jgi:hypothetical protein
MGDDVVQLAGDPRALLEHHPPGVLGLADPLLLGEPATGSGTTRATLSATEAASDRR